MQLIDTAKEKRMNAILYFCKHTKKRNLYQTKMFKLLYYLDFLNFKEVGKPVTDLEYYAWDFGPVPRKLYFEIKENKGIKNICHPEIDNMTGKERRIKFASNHSPDMTVFSKREIKILEWIAEVLKDASSEDMSNSTHLKNAPWDVTIRTKGEKAYIDFLLAIDDESHVDISLVKEQMRRAKETEKFFGFKD